MNLPENIEVAYQNEWWTFLVNTDLQVSVSVPTDGQEIGRVAKLLSDFNPAKQVYPVYGEDKRVVGCLS